MTCYLLQAKLSTAQKSEQIVSVKTPLHVLDGHQALTQALDLINKDYGTDCTIYSASITKCKM